MLLWRNLIVLSHDRGRIGGGVRLARWRGNLGIHLVDQGVRRELQKGLHLRKLLPRRRIELLHLLHVELVFLHFNKWRYFSLLFLVFLGHVLASFCKMISEIVG